MFSLISIASASDSPNDNLATHYTNQDKISVSESQSSLSDTSTTEKTTTTSSSSDTDNEKKTITMSSSDDKKTTTSSVIEEKTTSSKNNDTLKEQTNTINDKVLKSSDKKDKLTDSGDTFIVDANGGGDYTSISAAVSAATGGETIFIKNGEYTETAKIDIGTKQLTFEGESQDGVIIKYSGSNELFTTTSSGYTSLTFNSLTFKDISMTGARTPISIGGINSEDDVVTIKDCTFDNCKSRYGAIRIFTKGVVTIENTKFLNTASLSNKYSSAIYLAGAGSKAWTLKNIYIYNATSSSSDFGVIYLDSDYHAFNIENLTMVNCNGLASAIYTKGNLNINNSKIINNSFIDTTSGIFYVNGVKTLNIETTIIINNSATYIINTNGASTINLNYNNIQTNTFNTAFTNPDYGTYNLDYNYWGSNDEPDYVTVSDYAIYENGEFKLHSGNAMEKEIPDITSSNEPITIFVSEDGLDTNDGLSDDNPTTLSNALNIFKNNDGTLKISEGTYNIHDCEIVNDLTIIGQGNVILDADNTGRLFNVTNSASLILENLKLINGLANQGGAIFVDTGASLTLKNVKLENNHASYGGAIYSNGTLSISGSNFVDNKAEKGGAIYINKSTDAASITSSKFTGNDATESGDAIFTNAAANINYNVLIPNENNDNLINATTTTVDAENNWWGNSTPDFTKLVDGVTVTKKISMNVTPTEVNKMYVGDNQDITVTFRDGDDKIASKLPELNVNVGDAILTKQNNAYKYTYTAPSDLTSDALNVICGSQTVEVVIRKIAKYNTGIVYVSTDGNDDNEGTSIEDSVATIGKAIEIATSTGNGNITILEGTYIGYGYHVTKNLTVIGQGKVILDANNEGRLFYMDYGDTAGILSLANLAFTNANGYGAAVYSFADKLVLENINITNCNPTGYLIRQGKDMILNNSKIFGNSEGDIIQISGNGNVIVNNTLFKNNDITGSTSVYGVLELSSGNGNLIVENSQFINNIGRQGVITGQSNSKDIVVKNSQFINNTNVIFDGGCIYATKKLTVTNSTFINNRVINTEGRSGGAINIGSHGDATITKSVFINNSATNDGDAIANSGKLTINYSILLTNSTHKIITSTQKADAQFNWWGTNDNPEGLVSTNVNATKWIIMNVDPTTFEDVAKGTPLTINVDFEHYNTTDGTIAELPDTDRIHELPVSLDNGTETTKFTKDNKVTFTYTATKDQIIHIKSGNQVTPVTINLYHYKGIVYVSTTGDDEDEGSETKPVASIAKAIEIATAEGGSGKIIVLEGTYTDNGLTIDKNLTITGQGNVIINANNAKLFNIANANVTISNLVLTGASGDEGSVIYNDNANLTLNNIILENNGGNLIYNTGNNNLTMIKVTVTNHNGGNVIKTDSTGNITIKDSLFKNNNINGDGILFVDMSTLEIGNLIVENSQFINNSADEGVLVYGCMDTDATITIKGSKFINNTNRKSNYGNGGAITSYVKLNVVNSTFINNKAEEGGALYVIMADANINNCILLTNTDLPLIINAYGMGTVNADNNYWGSNTPDFDTLLEEVDEPDNWVVMTITATTEEMFTGNTQTITVDFTKDNLNKQLAENIPELRVLASSDFGTITPSVIVTENNKALFTYTAPSSAGEATINFNKQSIKVEIKDLTTIIQELVDSIKELNNTIQQQNQTINELNQTINDLNNTIKDQNKTINELKGNITDLQEQVGDVNVTALNKTIEGLKDTINTLQEQVGNVNVTALNKTIEGLKDTINTLQEQVGDVNVTALNNKLTAANSEIAQLKDNVTNLSKNLTAANNRISALEQQNNTTTPNIPTSTAPAETTKTTTKLTLKKVKTIRRSAKKLVLTAIIKINGKAAKSKKVTFTFNGKKYTRKTNAKGIAKLVLKKAVLRKLKVGKKVKYSVKYGKITRNRNNVVKK